MSKDILVIRPAVTYDCLTPEETDKIVYAFKNIFKKQYITVILFKENQTDKTSFEIIKNE